MTYKFVSAEQMMADVIRERDLVVAADAYRAAVMNEKLVLEAMANSGRRGINEQGTSITVFLRWHDYAASVVSDAKRDLLLVATGGKVMTEPDADAIASGSRPVWVF